MQEMRATHSISPTMKSIPPFHNTTIPPIVLEDIEKLATKLDTTVDAAMLAMLRVLLSCYGHRHDISIETAISSKNRHAQTTLQLPLAADHSVENVLARVTSSLRQQGQAGPLPGGDHHLICAFEYYETDEPRKNPAPSALQSPYAFALRALRSNRGLTLTFHSRHDILAHDTLEHCAASYLYIARQIASNPALTIAEIDFVPTEQRQTLLGSFIDTRFPTKAKTIGDLFTECVRWLPHNRAVTHQGHSLTYAQLEARVDALACALAHNGLKIGDRVAIHMKPSTDIAVALLGSLRAGGTYVPIDIEQPIERARHVLRDSGARFLIGQADSQSSLAFDGYFIDIDQLPVPYHHRAPLPTLRPNDSAYLIYTSGTTGQPKGACIEHHSLLNYVEWFCNRYGIDSTRTAALLTSHAFDLGYTVLWTTLLSGGELHFLPSSTCKDPAAILSYLQENDIDFIKVTPSLSSALLRSPAFNSQSLASLRLIVTGGESVRVSDIKTIYDSCPDVQIINHYGPTETTIGALTHPIPRDQLEAYAKQPVIGRPIGNVRAYITSPDLKLMPIGAAGELLLAGRGVGRGYHARDALTAEKFIPDPFHSGGACYRTGDLARWTRAGAIEFLGRMDRQVKIRGFRVELTEIEQVMLRRLALDDVVVVNKALSESNNALCAYYVANETLPPSDTLAILRQALPPYMVPLSLTKVSSIPRSANGKLDIAQLPEPIFETTLHREDAPSNDTEAVLLELWTELLGIEHIGVSQDFLALGGHSLLMVQLIAEIHGRFNVMVPMSFFFGEGTIRALASFIHGDTDA